MGKMRLAAVLFIFVNILTAGMARGEERDGIQEAKQGVVKVCSGITTEDGVFHKIHDGSGFVVAGGDGQAYVVTACHAVVSSEEEKLAFCEANGISTENPSFQDTIRVVVKGDVAVEAAPLVQSAEQDYAVLEVNGGISERTPLALGTAEDMVTGDTVYALGFADGAGEGGDGTEFSPADVQIHEGTVQDARSGQNGSFYIQHSAPVSAGNAGGPLLNRDGYVVGQNSAAAGGQDGIYYSLPISEIREALDNFQVDYGSLEKDQSLESLQALLSEARALIDSKKYKASSKTALEEAAKNADQLLENGAGIEELAAAGSAIEEAKGLLQQKMPLSRKAVIVLGAVAALLFLWLLRLIVWKIGAKKKAAEANRRKKDASAPPSGESGRIAQPENRTRETGREENTETPDRRAVTPAARKPGGKKPAGDEEEGTVILGRDDPLGHMPLNFRTRKETGFLCRFSANQVFPLDKPELAIGKKAEANDLALADNPAVSRRHARIFWENQDYYIVDLGSANGTFVNSARLEPDIPQRLKDGDTIVLADERFGFTLEENRR